MGEAATFIGDEGFTGNLFSGDESFRGLLVGDWSLRGDRDVEVGDVRLFSIFKGEVCSRSMRLFAESRDVLTGERFSRSSNDSDETLGTKGEEGGLSLLVGSIVTSYS